ncbi:MAG: M1 family metallopeptidase, partial [Gemmatimonadaceae bacterium]
MFKPLRFAAAALVLSAIGSPLVAQATRLPTAMFDVTGVADTSIFAPLNLPAGTVYRSGSGIAGPKYFQQRADYDLHGTLDTAAKALKGEMTLRYTNNSPDTLRFIWIQTEQNAFKAGSLNSFVFPADSRFGARNFEGGDVFDHFNQVVAGKRTASKLRVEGTVTKVDLVAPLAPGQMATFDVAWHFLIPEHGADRMGRDGALYELAQWYPRVCVYDDLRGWNTEPYLGQGEFYLEYGDYKLAVTVPAGYIVAATGVLENPSEVLTAAQISRLATAKSPKSDSTVVHIITADELKNGTARKSKNGMVTWRFAAHSVRDAVWAASPDYMWDATNYKGHMAYAYYRPSAIDTWKEAADMSRMSIQEYSERWFPYPYPQISAVEGPISGMEYPMLAMETKSETAPELYNVVTHEIGHMWYPMIVG